MFLMGSNFLTKLIVFIVTITIFTIVTIVCCCSEETKSGKNTIKIAYIFIILIFIPLCFSTY